MGYVHIIISPILAIAIIYLLFKRQSLTLKDGDCITFKEKGQPDWVIKKQDGKLITGIKKDGQIIEKSTM